MAGTVAVGTRAAIAVAAAMDTQGRSAACIPLSAHTQFRVPALIHAPIRVRDIMVTVMAITITMAGRGGLHGDGTIDRHENEWIRDRQ